MTTFHKAMARTNLLDAGISLWTAQHILSRIGPLKYEQIIKLIEQAEKSVEQISIELINMEED